MGWCRWLKLFVMDGKDLAAQGGGRAASMVFTLLSLYIETSRLEGLTHWGWDKWPTFRRKHFLVLNELMNIMQNDSIYCIFTVNSTLYIVLKNIFAVCIRRYLWRNIKLKKYIWDIHSREFHEQIIVWLGKLVFLVSSAKCTNHGSNCQDKNQIWHAGGSMGVV